MSRDIQCIQNRTSTAAAIEDTAPSLNHFDTPILENAVPKLSGTDDGAEGNLEAIFDIDSSEILGPFDSFADSSSWPDAPAFVTEAFQTVPRPLQPTAIRPRSSPLNFLFNFTTSKGIASAFNFAFVNSRHKSQRYIAPPNISSESGYQEQNSPYMTSLPDVDQVFLNNIVNANTFETLDSRGGSWSLLASGPAYSPDLPDMTVQVDSGDTLYSEQGQPSQRLHISGFLNDLADPIFLRTRAIWLHLRESSLKVRPNTRVYSLEQPTDVSRSARCLEFFSPANLKSFIDIFWDDWYPHCPIIHRPSFNISRASDALLMVMALTGAALSPRRDDAELAREWFDSAEQFAFQELSGLNELEEDNVCNQHSMQTDLSTLQASFLMCCLQNWEGNKEAKTRIRRQRYSSLIEAARTIGFGNATHEGGKAWSGSGSSFEWSRFTNIEEMIR